MALVPNMRLLRRGRLALTCVLSLAAVVCGLTILASPLRPSSAGWTWRPQSATDVDDATVNAELAGIDEAGAVLLPQVSRPISLISPPLRLAADSSRILTITFALLDESDASAELQAGARSAVGDNEPLAEARETVVRLLWQTEPGERFRYESQAVRLQDLSARRVSEGQLGPRPPTDEDSPETDEAGKPPGRGLPRSGADAVVRFSLPDAPERIHRLGVQFPDVTGAVRVTSFSLTEPSSSQRLNLAWQQLNAWEPIGNHSVNFLVGPRILGHGLNELLLGAILLAAGLYGAATAVRRRLITFRVLAGIVLAAWFVADAQATRNLAMQAEVEVGELRGKDWPDRVAAIYGTDVAWAYDRLLRLSPPGASYAVVCDDSFTPSRRLDYLLVPARHQRTQYAQADSVVVLHAAGAVFDEANGAFRWNSGPVIRAELLEQSAPDAYLLRRRMP